MHALAMTWLVGSGGVTQNLLIDCLEFSHFYGVCSKINSGRKSHFTFFLISDISVLRVRGK